MQISLLSKYRCKDSFPRKADTRRTVQKIVLKIRPDIFWPPNCSSRRTPLLPRCDRCTQCRRLFGRGLKSHGEPRGFSLRLDKSLVKVSDSSSKISRRFFPPGAAERSLAIGIVSKPTCAPEECTGTYNFQTADCGNGVKAPVYCARTPQDKCELTEAPCAGVDICTSLAQSSCDDSCVWHQALTDTSTIGYCMDGNSSCSSAPLCAVDPLSGSSTFYVAKDGCVPSSWILVSPDNCGESLVLPQEQSWVPGTLSSVTLANPPTSTTVLIIVCLVGLLVLAVVVVGFYLRYMKTLKPVQVLQL